MKTHKIHMDFRIAGSFTVAMPDEEYEKFKAGYGEIIETMNRKVRQFKEGMGEVDRYSLILEEERLDDPAPED